MSCDHKLANEWACCSRKNATYITIVDVAWRCSRSSSYGQVATTVAANLRPSMRTSRNRMAKRAQQCCDTSYSSVTIVWPELANAGPTTLRCVALKCCDRLAGALRPSLLLLVRTHSAHHARHWAKFKRARWSWHRRNELRHQVYDCCDQIKFNEPVLKPGPPE